MFTYTILKPAGAVKGENLKTGSGYHKGVNFFLKATDLMQMKKLQIVNGNRRVLAITRTLSFGLSPTN